MIRRATGRERSVRMSLLSRRSLLVGTTTARKSEITFADGGAVETNFADYPLISIDEMPDVVPIILPSARPPQGFGEVVLAPLAPAIAQALRQATGRELASMPFPDDAFRLN